MSERCIKCKKTPPALIRLKGGGHICHDCFSNELDINDITKQLTRIADTLEKAMPVLLEIAHPSITMDKDGNLSFTGDINKKETKNG
jgi:hypothetical protein